MSMTNGWAPQVELGKLLVRQRVPIDVDDDKRYKRVTVRLNGRGVVLRDQISGAEIGTKRQFAISREQFLLSKIDARNGAFGMVPPECDGAIITGNFWAFDPVPDLLDTRYFNYLTQTRLFADFSIRASEGTTNRRYLQEDRFLRQAIPLPPLAEQRRIVAKIDSLAGRIDEAGRLQAVVRPAIEAVPKAYLQRLCREYAAEGRLSDVLIDKPRNGWSAKCDGNPDGTAVLSLSAVTGYFYDQSKVKFTSLPTVAGAHYWLARGDLLITRSNSPELVGHVAIYNGAPSPCIYPDLMMKLTVNQELASTEFVWCWLQTPLVRDFIASNASGTSPSMKKISQKIAQRIPFPSAISPLDQQGIVRRFKSVGATCVRAAEASEEASAKLAGLRSSILDRAFRGHL